MLKKPSQFFNGDDSSSSQDNSKNFDVNSDAYKSLKENVEKINAISDVSETLEQYRKSIEDVNLLSEEVGSIRTEIQSLLTTEDLDRALMGSMFLLTKLFLTFRIKSRLLIAINLVRSVKMLVHSPSL